MSKPLVLRAGLLLVLVLSISLTGCVQVSGAGKYSGTYSFDCLKRSRLLKQIKPYHQQIESQRAEFAQEIHQLESIDLRLSHSYTFEGEPGAGACRTVTTRELHSVEQPPLACDRTRAEWLPVVVCELPTLVAAGCSPGIAALGLTDNVGQQAVRLCRQLRSGTGNDTPQAVVESLLIEAGLDFAFGMARDSIEQGYLGEGLLTGVLAAAVALENKRQCWSSMSRLCTVLQQEYEIAQRLVDRPGELTERCREQRAQRQHILTQIRQARSEIDRLRAEVAPLEEDLQSIHRQMAATGVNCGS